MPEPEKINVSTGTEDLLSAIRQLVNGQHVAVTAVGMHAGNAIHTLNTLVGDIEIWIPAQAMMALLSAMDTTVEK